MLDPTTMSAPNPPGDTTLRVHAAAGQSRETPSALLRVSRLELRRLTRRLIAARPPEAPLEPTSVVNEVARRLLGASGAQDLPSRGDFFADMAVAFRRMLRGGGPESLPCDVRLSTLVGHDRESPLASELDRALEELELQSPQHAQIATMHLFSGMTYAEIAEQLFISESVAAVGWSAARDWLDAWLIDARRSR